MIIILKGADFSASNIGTLSTWRITRSLGAGATYEGATLVDKGASFTATVTIAEGYELGSAGVIVTMGGNVISATTVNGNTITINIAEVTGNVVIKVSTVNLSTGEEEEPEEKDILDDYTLYDLSTDASAWRLATVGETGIGADGSNSKRLFCAEPIAIPESQRIVVTCAEGYQWGLRSGESSTKLPQTQYWLNSGDELQIAWAPAGGVMYLGFRKITGETPPTCSTTNADTQAITMTKDDIALIQPRLYFRNEYTAEFDTSNYELVETLDGSADKWLLAVAGETGFNADGSTQTRLFYNQELDATKLCNADTILVTCAEGYQFGMRVNNGGTTYPQNMYWYNSGTCLRFSVGGTKPVTQGTPTKYLLGFRKTGNHTNSAATQHDLTLTKADGALINAKIYTAKQS